MGFSILLKYALSLNGMSAIRYFSCLMTVVFTLLFCSCNAQNDDNNASEDKGKEIESAPEAILFIGNSHTYYNQGLATHLLEFRKNDGSELEPVIQEVAKGGYSLEDHLNDPSSLSKINERNWDYVIFQENTSVAAEALESTTDAMIVLADMVAQNNTEILLFMTWPYEERPEMLNGIKKTYESGAKAINATIVPVGEDWTAIDTETEIDVEFYDADGVHATLEGTFYASAKFYKAIYGKTPSQNPYTAGLPTTIANYLKSKAE